MLIRLIKIDVFRKMPKIPIFWIAVLALIAGVAYTISNDSLITGNTVLDDGPIFDQDFGNLNSDDQGVTSFDEIDGTCSTFTRSTCSTKRRQRSNDLD